MEAIFELLGQRTDMTRYVLVGTLMLMRLLPITFITPFLGGKLVPPETRMSLAFLLLLLSFPYAQDFMSGPITLNPIVFVVLMFKELFIGFVVGFLSSKVFLAMEMAGRMLDTLRGSNMAEVQVPEIQLRATPLGDFLFHLLLILYMGINGHIFFIDSLIESFRIVPVDGWPRFGGSFEEWVELVLHYGASMFTIAFAITFPGMFATFMLDVVFGMLNRVAPQLNAYTLAMGIKSLAGIAFLFFSLSLVISQLGRLSTDTVTFLNRIIALLG